MSNSEVCVKCPLSLLCLGYDVLAVEYCEYSRCFVRLRVRLSSFGIFETTTLRTWEEGYAGSLPPVPGRCPVQTNCGGTALPRGHCNWTNCEIGKLNSKNIQPPRIS
jgi:hypothetical protein